MERVPGSDFVLDFEFEGFGGVLEKNVIEVFVRARDDGRGLRVLSKCDNFGQFIESIGVVLALVPVL